MTGFASPSFSQKRPLHGCEGASIIMKQIAIRPADPSDVSALAELYIDCFPEHTRSKLGKRICKRYFEEVLSHSAYRLIVADVDDVLVGFVVLHTDMNNYLSDRWMLTSPGAIIRLAIGEPHQTISRIRKGLHKLLKKRSKASRQPLSNKSSEKNFGYIDNLAVYRNARRLGVGRSLLEAAFHECSRAGLSFVRLTVVQGNESAIRLYEGMGFSFRTRVGEEANYQRKLDEKLTEA